jgi:Icc-related predicted phosphoesterase
VRIASVSDIHTDFAENRDVMVKLAAEIYHRGADVVIVAGDVSHKNDRIERALVALSYVAGRVAYLPGNHDLWFDVPHAPSNKGINTWARYRSELRELAEKIGAHYLPASPLVIDRVAIAGTCGWYDYSLAPEAIRTSIGDEALAAKTFGGVMWSDARFIAFRNGDAALMSDAEVARQMEAELAEQLRAIDDDPAIDQCVVVTHHLPFDEVVTHTGTLPWEFFNAFMGSSSLGRIIKETKKAKVAIYGHTHLVGERTIDRLRVFGTPLGYPRERKGLTLDEVVATRIGWIEL